MDKETARNDAALHADHRKRVRAKFLEYGVTGMEDHQILELLLFYAIPRHDTNGLAHRLLKEFGSLSSVFEAPVEALTRVPGIGPDTAVLLKLLPAIWKRCRRNESDQTRFITDRETMQQALQPMFTEAPFEQFVCAMTDGRGLILKKFVVDTGGMRTVHADVDTIVREAVINRAESVAVAHSHPSGFAAPSSEDVQSTVFLAHRLEQLGIRLLDHMISAPDGTYFLSDCNKIPAGSLVFEKKKAVDGSFFAVE